MAKDALAGLPEVFLSSTALSSAVSRAVRAGRVRKLGPRLYTRNLTDPAEAVIRRNLWPVVGLLFPGSVVAYRTALEAKPTPKGSVFLSGPYDRVVRLPGLRIRQIAGAGPLEGDSSFVRTLWLASQPRALLECLSFRRIRGGESPALPREEIEAWLGRLVEVKGESAANALRDRARALTPALGAEGAYEELDGILGALLRTRPGPLSDPAARARAAGEPYDSRRIELFQILHAALAAWTSRPRPDEVRAGPVWDNLAFIDAYFSNFIEGTEFGIEEAAAIVFEQRIPRNRPEDAHDILGTYRLVSSLEEMTTSFRELSFNDLLRLLRRRHYMTLSARSDAHPGEFKTEINRAGLTVFVEPELVIGTLRQGFEIFRALEDPFHRAAAIMFLVAEVHPFDDGNGRIARAMMNAELIAGGERRIFIPISYREDYLLALRAFSRQENPKPLLEMLDRAQAYSAAIDFADLGRALAVLTQTNAFERGPDAQLRIPEQDR